MADDLWIEKKEKPAVPGTAGVDLQFMTAIQNIM